MTIDVVPIGKYKGLPVERLMADQSYSEWLLAQSWFLDRYADLAQLLRMGRLNEPQDTPEHNAMIAGLIDQRDAMECLAKRFCWNPDVEDLYSSDMRQEIEPKGGDIFIQLGSARMLIEAKPLIGDDYPSVIRQVKAYNDPLGPARVVIAREVAATNLTLEQVRRQFNLAGVHLVIEGEFFEAGKKWAKDRYDYLRTTIAALDVEIQEAKAELTAAQSARAGGVDWWTEQSRITDATDLVARLNDRMARLLFV